MIAGYDRSMLDPFQVSVLMRPADDRLADKSKGMERARATSFAHLVAASAYPAILDVSARALPLTKP